MPAGRGSVQYALSLELGREMAASEVARHAVRDNPPCCNPRHLAAGSVQDNSDDMTARGRQARGERSRHAKLTVGHVRSIRALREQGLTLSAIAGRFEVDPTAIGQILRGETWMHVR